MKTAITWAYTTSRDNIKERNEKREWRKSFDPNYVSRRSMFSQRFSVISRRESKGRMLSMFGRPVG